MNLHSKQDGNPSGAVKIVYVAFFAAITIVAQVVLSPLANIELVTLFFILFTLTLGKLIFPIVGIFVLVEGLIYGFGLWFINYLYIWFILVLIAFAFRDMQKPLFWAILSGIYGLCFGLLCSIPYIFIGGLPFAFSYWLSGIPFDLIHGAGNFFLAMVLFNPLYKVLKKII